MRDEEKGLITAFNYQIGDQKEKSQTFLRSAQQKEERKQHELQQGKIQMDTRKNKNKKKSQCMWLSSSTGFTDRLRNSKMLRA